MKIYNKIITVIYAISISISILIVILLMSLSPHKNRQIRRAWGRLQHRWLDYKLEVIGESNKEANLIIMNHKSMLDIIVMEEIHPANLCWIAKIEIEKLPIFGKIISIPKMISVDRKNPRALPKIIKEVDDRVRNKRVIAMFPEGTRARSDKFLKFQSGAKAIANKLNLKVQPVVLINTGKILNSHDFSIKRHEKLTVVYLDLIDTGDENWLEKTREKMQEIFDKFKGLD